MTDKKHHVCAAKSASNSSGQKVLPCGTLVQDMLNTPEGMVLFTKTFVEAAKNRKTLEKTFIVTHKRRTKLRRRRR